MDIFHFTSIMEYYNLVEKLGISLYQHAAGDRVDKDNKGKCIHFPLSYFIGYIKGRKVKPNMTGIMAFDNMICVVTN